MKKLMSTILVAAIFGSALLASGCGTEGASQAPASAGGSAVSGKVTGSGSSALLPLAQDAAKAFKEKYPDVSVTLNAGGSGNGLKQVSDGSVDIGNSDVAAETKLTADKAKELVDHKVCVITMAPIVSNDVGEKVKSLTKEQLQKIFTGETKNWKEVGGPDEAIVLVTRPKTSGTRALFTQYALDGKEEASNKSLETDNSGTLIKSVEENQGAIGYVALSYLVGENKEKVTAVGIDGVQPTLENTYSGKYPVWGYEHMYTKGEPSGAVKSYLDFIASDDYGKKMEGMGYGITAKMDTSVTSSRDAEAQKS
ncbi:MULTISPECIES: phosphate ABC transporter substrate-binding protein [Caproicibacterium]|uniref:Phosphate-binding protein n=1 Tax=Caproicibacterium argilliputei TaxID=3030016 RepID=A0AA97DCV4_9FIRM|nr:phosphate ABC transporter substrate-binding protein [Caproicibacterium argilliputei]WOC33262.1 phosphate ABC transporter substrate-binding protein [Caproicibacterium argilliputei]